VSRSTTTRIFRAARIHSMNPRAPAGNAILVENGRIRAVTTFDAARTAAPGAEVNDLGNVTITPGLTDAHIHLTEWSVARAQVDLAHCTSIGEAARTAASGGRNQGWILGRGWNAHRWNGEYPERSALDEVISDAPVALQSHDMHAMWLNTRALEQTGILEYSGDPDGGRILRDDHGVPLGVLLENAAQLVVPHLPRYDVDSIIPLVEAAQHELHAYGITGVHSFPGVHLKDPDPLPVVQVMRERGVLALRILQHIALEKLQHAVSIGVRSGLGDDWIRIGGVKMFLDGALGSRTAWMREPYENSRDRGVQVMAENDFRSAVTLAAENGIASVVHAIGDAAVALAFQVLSEDAIQVTALPHRVEHVQCTPANCEGIADKVICSVQPSHLMTDWRAADAHWGGRAASTYAFRAMIEKHATLAFGSDAPVEPADPRHGLFAAVTRTDLAHEPHGGWQARQKLTVAEALAGYTIGPARAAGIAARNTGLVPGALADFVAWKQDPLNVEPAGLLELQPAATIVAGDMVYEN
jgi:predicted amidohydrolase YtcJ